MPKMIKKYERMLQNGIYENENELCNALGLNYDDIYEDEKDDDDGGFFSAPSRRTKPLFGGSTKKNKR